MAQLLFEDNSNKKRFKDKAANFCRLPSTYECVYVSESVFF